MSYPAREEGLVNSTLWVLKQTLFSDTSHQGNSMKRLFFFLLLHHQIPCFIPCYCLLSWNFSDKTWLKKRFFREFTMYDLLKSILKFCMHHRILLYIYIIIHVYKCHPWLMSLTLLWYIYIYIYIYIYVYSMFTYIYIYVCVCMFYV